MTSDTDSRATREPAPDHDELYSMVDEMRAEIAGATTRRAARHKDTEAPDV